MSSRRIDLEAVAPAGFVLVCIVAGIQLGSYLQYVVAISLVSAMVGVALVVLVGLARCITLASASIMAIGAYASTLSVTAGLPYVLSVFVALIFGALAGWLLALPGKRFRGHNLAMVTLVFQSVAIILIRESKWLTGGAEGIRVPTATIFGQPLLTDTSYLLWIGSVAVVTVLLLTILIRGPFGKNMRASATNEIAAEAFGISVSAYLTAAFVMSSAAIALAGAVLAPRVRIIDPDSFGVLASIFMLAYPIVGGMHSVWGGLLGGGGLRVLPEVLRFVADYQEFIFATLVVLVVMFFPGGLCELILRCKALIFRGWASTLPEAISTRCPPVECSFAPAREQIGPLLKVKAVGKRFGALRAVDDVSLAVVGGGIHGLIGPNGAGKTSLFNIISGFLPADSGTVSFDNIPLLDLPARNRMGLGITRTFQHVAIFGQLSCLDNVIIGLGQNRVPASMRQSFDWFVGGSGSQAARAKAFDALAAVGLEENFDELASALSLGNQRRLELARAVVSEPRLILLDEPVSGVAEKEVEGLRELLLRINRERGIAMLVVEHNIPFVAGLCRSISVMGAGQIIAEGDPKEVIALPSVRELYFGEERAA